MLQTGRNRIHTEKFTLARLDRQEDFRCTESFDCGLDDLNEFFREDALPHKVQLLAETYYFQPAALTEAGELFPVGFVSFLNDSVHIERDERKAGKKRTKATKPGLCILTSCGTNKLLPKRYPAPN